jgi:glycosyltransferase involved in cell wall biosynthesis
MFPAFEKNKPLVSVVIPSFNAERWITETIESVFAQDYPSLELIVVDDCSSDTTFEIASSLTTERNINRIIQKNPQNMGECWTSNRGFDLATGAFITRISSDDKYVDPHHISNQVETLERTGADWCYNSVTATGSDLENSRLERGYWLPVPLKYAREPMKHFDNLVLRFPSLAFRIWVRRNPVNSSSLMIRAGSYRKIAGDTPFRTTWDTIILGRMFRAGFRGVAIDSVGTFYRIHRDQTLNNPVFWDELPKIRDSFH